MSKITLKDTVEEIISKMADGNPGATRVLIEMLTKGDKIDPQAWAGGLGAIMQLDTDGIYGSRIWMLYKDVCGQDLVKLIASLRAVQLGHISEATLSRAIDNYGDGIDIDKILEKVKAELEQFDRQPVEGVHFETRCNPVDLL